MQTAQPSLEARLSDWARDESRPPLVTRLQKLIDNGYGELPFPARGHTLERWRALAAVAAHDLSLVKLYEGHTDALAILAELTSSSPASGTRWGVWAAEPPTARLRCHSTLDEQARLEGRKAWCSGARDLSHALVTAWDDQDRQCLLAVALDQPGVEITSNGWHAVGMAETSSVEVIFTGAAATPVGAPGAYLDRPGFWQGGAGIAACWYGAATSLAQALHAQCRQRDEPHAMAHLGAVDTALTAARAVLVEAAGWIDAHPDASAQWVTQRARATVEAAVETVILHTGRALGASPFCQNAHFARQMADLPVFIRQSHAERDLAGLATLVIEEPTPWAL